MGLLHYAFPPISPFSSCFSVFAVVAHRSFSIIINGQGSEEDREEGACEEGDRG